MRIAALIILLILGAAMAVGSWAQAAAQPQPSAVQVEPDAEPSLGTRILMWGLAQQRALHRTLTQRMRELSERMTIATLGALMATSFLYGIFHAAGPGHGKAIITTYLLTRNEKIRRGLWISTAASLCQGLVAIVLVYGLVAVAGWAPRDTETTVAWTERMSFALVMMIGSLLVWRGARALGRRWRERSDPPHGHSVHHRAAHDRVHNDGGHDHCGHNHAPAQAQLEAARGFRDTAGVILSIGLRPCSGAVLVLAVAEILGSLWAGVGAVAAMSLGTASAIAILAFLVVRFRERAVALARSRIAGPELAMHAIGLIGGMAILWIGAALLVASFGTQNSPVF
jgi:nickel/cobalt exporter